MTTDSVTSLRPMYKNMELFLASLCRRDVDQCLLAADVSSRRHESRHVQSTTSVDEQNDAGVTWVRQKQNTCVTAAYHYCQDVSLSSTQLHEWDARAPCTYSDSYCVAVFRYKKKYWLKSRGDFLHALHIQRESLLQLQV